MSALPEGTALGRLQLLEVYDYYDCPRLFAARNAVGTTYFVLWADDLGDQDVWLYVPVSGDRLADLRQGSIAIRDAFLNAEDGNVYRVVETKSTGQATCASLGADSLELDWLPPENDRLSLADAPSAQSASDMEEPEGADWLRKRIRQGVKISRTTGRLPPPLVVVERILSHWRQLFVEAAGSMGSRAEMLPIRAVPGSFEIELAINDPAAASATFRLLAKMLRRAGAVGATNSPQLDLATACRSLLTAIVANDVEVQIRMTGAGEDICLTPRVARELRDVASNAVRRRVPSSQIPQADDIQRIFRVLELATQGKEITAKRLEVVPRQVDYYKHAGRVLGYLDDENELTAPGAQVVRLGPDERLASCAVQMENSTVGSAWILWAKGNSLADVSAESAQGFLEAMSDLSPSTASRRAQTLISWHSVLLPHHYSRWLKRRT